MPELVSVQADWVWVCLLKEGFICICEWLNSSESKLIVWVCICHCLCNEGFICIHQCLSLRESKLIVRVCVCLRYVMKVLFVSEYLSVCESKLIGRWVGGGGAT